MKHLFKCNICFFWIYHFVPLQMYQMYHREMHPEACRKRGVRPAELKHISVGLNLTAAVVSWYSCFEWILLLSYNINRTNTSNLKCFSDDCYTTEIYCTVWTCYFIIIYEKMFFFMVLGTRITYFSFIRVHKRFRIWQKQNWNIKEKLETSLNSIILVM